MARMIVYLVNQAGYEKDAGVWVTEESAVSLINRGVAMDAEQWRAMKEAKKEHNKEMRHAREDKAKAPDKPKKDKMVRSPVKKKTAPKPAEDVMRWRK